MSTDYYANDKATLGDRIAAAREAANLDVTGFASRLGVRSGSVLAWEHDETEPRANHLAMMAGLCGVSLAWLITGHGEGPSDGTSDPRQHALEEIRAIKQDLNDAISRLDRLEAALTHG